MVETKYNSLRGGWCSKKVTSPFGVRAWKYIRRGEKFSLDLLDMRWEIGPMSGFDMICGVENSP
jgi:hypothetical protein